MKKYLILFYLSSLVSCQTAPPLNESPLQTDQTLSNTNLRPGSKGEQLRPGSKGESKFGTIEGQLIFPKPLTASELPALTATLDGEPIAIQTLKTEVNSTNEQSIHFKIENVPTQSNQVLAIKYKSWPFSAMINGIKANQSLRQSVSLMTTSVVSVARLAEQSGIRKIKDWKADELNTLSSLPELSKISDAINLAFQDEDKRSQDLLAIPETKNIIQDVMNVFIQKLEN